MKAKNQTKSSDVLQKAKEFQMKELTKLKEMLGEGSLTKSEINYVPSKKEGSVLMDVTFTLHIKGVRYRSV